MNGRTLQLRHLANVRISNVDKKSNADQVPVRLVNYTDVYYGDLIVPELELMVATASPNQVTMFGLEPGDVVITKDSESADDIGVPAFVQRSEVDMVCGYHLAILRPGPRVDGRFLYWAINSDGVRGQMELAATGVTRFGLRTDAINQLRLQVPRYSEQRAIADYLDTETTRIDALISKKRRLIDLLDERKALLGEEGLARLRETEKSVPLKHLVSEKDVRCSTKQEPELLSVSIHQGVVPKSTNSDNRATSDDLSKYKICDPGDIVINRMRAFQGGLGVAPQKGIVSPDYTVLRTGNRVTPSYLHYLMRSSWFVSEMTRRLRGIGATDQGQVRTPRINFADMGLIEVPVPSIENQDALSAELVQQEAHLTQLVDLQTKQLTLLAERRQALITAAVTGAVPVPPN